MGTDTSTTGAAGSFGRNWWVFLLRGFLALFLGIMVFRQPVLALGVLVLGFAAYAIFEGVSALFAAILGWSYRKGRRLLLLQAAVGIGIGSLMLGRPGTSVLVLIFFIAAWAVATGIIRIAEAVNLDGTSGRGWLTAGGIASIIFAWLVLFRPLTRVLAMATTFGLYALFLGITEIVLAVRLRGGRELGRSAGHQPAHPRAA
jgi:uncharacterized membrane protein HdeD (DUF308 family)